MTRHNGPVEWPHVTTKWVALSAMRIPPAYVSQRKFIQEWASHIQANMDLTKIGVITVNFRDGFYYVMDGQHRRAALIRYLGEDQEVECRVYEGLSEADEANAFHGLNHTRIVDPFTMFKVAVAAGHPVESAIDTIVRDAGCVVAREHREGHVTAVNALRRVYSLGPATLARTLAVVGFGLGQSAYDGHILIGVAMVMDRYGTKVEDDHLVANLLTLPHGSKGLTQRAHLQREYTGATLTQCVAAAVVDIYNVGIGNRGTRRLPKWWTKDGEA